MELSWLRTFTDAAETLNFRKTSERLLMSQPNVTVHIRLLEEHLGVKLFRREKNRVLLTEEGRLFQQEAQAILDRFDAGITRLRSYAQGYRRKWTLAITPLMAETVLPYLLRSFMTDHADVELAIRVEESIRIEELVVKGEVSAGISARPAVSRQIETRLLYTDPLLFIVPRDAYDDESGPPIQAHEMFNKYSLFTGHHPTFWEELLLQLRNRLPNVRTMEVTQAHIAKRFIQEGLGVSFLPKSTVRRELIEGRIIEGDFELFPLPTVGTYLLTGKVDTLELELAERIQAIYFG
ncbi:LysR family transcriptional regulator [Planococcus lenghuensis]|uniref:LysR family transcriptional regulator n=1 Tax=Planococcus lenghuensis TaxID=2213202 RepID=A0A1Q2KUD6_9BACL|nr:LysR family transcriptional regulator [Planococcus lenghuensis]AQQ51820.1 LysR family transcriptional regulator [Planococcus lenghuensis]